MPRSSLTSTIVSAAVCAVCSLTASVVMAQPETQRKQPQTAGCPGEPAEFLPCALEKAKTYTPPKTEDGLPDIRGYWASGRQVFVIEAHPPGQGLSGETSVIVDPPDGRMPFLPQAAAKRQEISSKHELLKPSIEYIDPSARCFPKGIPRQNMNNPFPIEFFETRDHVYILHEQNHVYQVIPLDGTPHVGKDIKLWMGDSRGHWEGNTLVVETTNHNGKGWLDETGAAFSDKARVTERYTPLTADVMLFRATIEDASVFSQPWTISFPLRRNQGKDLERMEFACHEGNKSIDLQLTKPSDQKK
jgi:hypothetical protein